MKKRIVGILLAAALVASEATCAFAAPSVGAGSAIAVSESVESGSIGLIDSSNVAKLTETEKQEYKETLVEKANLTTEQSEKFFEILEGKVETLADLVETFPELTEAVEAGEELVTAGIIEFTEIKVTDNGDIEVTVTNEAVKALKNPVVRVRKEKEDNTFEFVELTDEEVAIDTEKGEIVFTFGAEDIDETLDLKTYIVTEKTTDAE
jgi:predicted glutamine amidotransferase